MTQSNFKTELLKQDGVGFADSEVKALKQMIESEDRRASRLARWATAAWVLFFLMVAASLIVPVLARTNAPVQNPMVVQPATNPVSQPPPIVQTPAPGIFSQIIGVIAMVGFFSLPFIGLTLTIKAILARRSVGRRQVLTALASIEAQLRMLSEARSLK